MPMYIIIHIKLPSTQFWLSLLSVIEALIPKANKLFSWVIAYEMKVNCATLCQTE